MQKFLIIQTAFIGDVVLATGIAEKLHRFYPEAQIDFMVRKGNETLLQNHPFIKQVWVWDKKNRKLINLLKLLLLIRSKKYTTVINVHRFGSSGFVTALSGAKERIGFNKNPWSFAFTKKVAHNITLRQAQDDPGGKPLHEIERNHQMIQHLTDSTPAKPRLYPTMQDEAAIKQYRQTPYICIAPASVWFTKQYPKEKWISFINRVPTNYAIYILGAPGDVALGNTIIADSRRRGITNLCSKLNFLQSAALQAGAVMNYVNDSAPMHFASAMNAPVTAVYCSTVPAFGFGPLSDKSFIVEIQEPLPCRPCGIHGLKACPLGHFNCAHKIKDEQLLETLTA